MPKKHKRLNAEALQDDLDYTFRVLDRAEKAITEAEQRDNRMGSKKSKASPEDDLVTQFPALNQRPNRPAGL